MKAAQFNNYGDNDVVIINNEASDPELAPGQVLIKVYAASINPADWKIREGYMQKMAPLELPAILGSDFSGVITKLGNEVKNFNVGDEVFGQAGRLTGGSGAFAEQAVAAQEKIHIKPKRISHTEAAALPLAGLSAVQALYDHAHLSKGQKILIHGGTGGIGSLAIPIAKHLGAFIATTVSTDNREQAAMLGADLVIDYQKEEFEKILSAYDVVFDTVGGATYEKSFQVLKPGGVIVSMLEQPHPELEKKYQIRTVAQFTQSTAERLQKLAELAEAGIVTPLIDRVFSLDQTKEALEYQQKSHPRGKVVIIIPFNQK